MASKIVASRHLLRYAANCIDNDTPDVVSQCALAKMFVTEQCTEVSGCDVCILRKLTCKVAMLYSCYHIYSHISRT